ncbi:small oligopeptide transporter, OPT family [Ilyonectria sp. MPI-CAGE-AT-0026]|nr:small oligopeptide transporter, OPT family [Ilyonectria sp. MPI-CAGE-AT-0026]
MAIQEVESGEREQTRSLDHDGVEKRATPKILEEEAIANSAGKHDGDQATSYEDSGYPEVRAAVLPTDEDLPVDTFRAWTLGIFFTIIMSGLNQFFNMHNPPISLSPYLVVLLSYPAGKLAERILPARCWNIFGCTFTLNPGPFNRKEHTLVAILSVASNTYNSGGTSSFVWTAMIKKFDIPVSASYRFMFIFTTQCLAIGLAGLFHGVLVRPSYCVWPSALPTCSLLNGMHDERFKNMTANGWKIGQMRFFWIVLGATTLYQILPGYLFTGLTTLAWITWIAPDNVLLNQLFGASTGMDLVPLTLDWNQIIAYNDSPLVIPTWALLNTAFGMVLFLWIISPALHWSNIWYGLYFPFSSSKLFDNTGAKYNVSRVINSDYTLNEQAYHDYSPVFMSTTSILSYGLGLAVMSALVVHSALFHGKEIWTGLKFTLTGKFHDAANEDIHIKLMKRYNPVPIWWYAATFVVTLGLAILFVEYFDTGLPWWGVILSAAINLILIIPNGIMTAICNITASTNIVSVLIGGYIWAGNIVAPAIFKIMTFATTGTAAVILRDMKIGQYMKIPPRSIFAAQCIGMVVNCVVQTGVNVWALANVEGICTDSASGSFTCPISSSYYASMSFWGLIGPNRLFGPGSFYNSMLYFFLIGALSPVAIWVLNRQFPGRFFSKIHIPVIMASISAIPPATAGNYMPWVIIGLVFQYYIKRYYSNWWIKYNYLLSAALNAGLAITSLLLFFCLYYPNVNLSWWGNNIAYQTADGLGTPLRIVAEGETFGPKTWN